MFVKHGECPACKAGTYTHSPWHGSKHPPVYFTCGCFPGKQRLPQNPNIVDYFESADAFHGDMTSLVGKSVAGIVQKLKREILGVAHCQDELLALQSDLVDQRSKKTKVAYSQNRDIDKLSELWLSTEILRLAIVLIKRMRGEG